MEAKRVLSDEVYANKELAQYIISDDGRKAVIKNDSFLDQQIWRYQTILPQLKKVGENQYVVSGQISVITREETQKVIIDGKEFKRDGDRILVIYDSEKHIHDDCREGCDLFKLHNNFILYGYPPIEVRLPYFGYCDEMAIIGRQLAQTYKIYSSDMRSDGYRCIEEVVMTELLGMKYRSSLENIPHYHYGKNREISGQGDLCDAIREGNSFGLIIYDYGWGNTLTIYFPIRYLIAKGSIINICEKYNLYGTDRWHKPYDLSQLRKIFPKRYVGKQLTIHDKVQIALNLYQYNIVRATIRRHQKKHRH